MLFCFRTRHEPLPSVSPEMAKPRISKSNETAVTLLAQLPRSDKVLTEVLEVRKAQRQAKKKAGDGPAPTDGPNYGKLVRSYYIDQADVTAFAKVLTGWSIGTDQGRFKAGTPGAFVFRENAHEPGSQVIMGERYQQFGFDQGVAVLRKLATEPSTARFIATKLVRHFVAWGVHWRH